MPLQATSGAASYDAFGGGVAAVPNYIEDVFATYLFTGTGANLNLVNGLKNDYTDVVNSVSLPPTTSTDGTSLTYYTNSIYSDSGDPIISTTSHATNGRSVQLKSFSGYAPASNSANFAYGTGNFCIELWVYRTDAASGRVFTHNDDSINLDIDNSGGLGTYQFGGLSASAGSVPLNTWTHIALTRSGTTGYLFVNGVQASSAGSISTNWSTNRRVQIGINNGFDGDSFPGLIGDVRVYKGSAKYTSNFTPATTLTTDTNVVFLVSYNSSTSFRSGTSSTQSINKQVMAWGKARQNGNYYALSDTLRGGAYALITNTTDAQRVKPTTGYIKSLLTNGIVLGSEGDINGNGSSMFNWAFRQQAKFFDVVTYTGNGTNGRTVAHSLGSTPGCIIVKRTDASNGWAVYHRAMNASPQDYMMRLNATDAAFTTSPSRWNNTLPTSTEFTLSGNDEVNGSGGTYVAYLFAHDAGGFGLSGTENVISCGSATASVGTWTDVNVGFEPQWVLIKNSTATGSYNPSGSAGSQDWYVIDTMRGATAATGSNTSTVALSANSSIAEYNDVWFGLTSTGFSFKGVTGGSDNFIYIAIRRGPMKVPTSGTSVFSPNALNAPADGTQVTTNFPVDLSIWKSRGGSYSGQFQDRLRGLPSTAGTGTATLYPDSTSAESDNQSGYQYWNTGFKTYSAENNIWWTFRRAPSFFDEVCYTGTGSATTFSHNLGVAPEMMIVKGRTNTFSWFVYQKDLTSANESFLTLNTDSSATSGSAVWNSTSPTSSVFSVGSANAINQSGNTYVAYLFATCAGVSKVGSYTGTATTLQVDCGFTSGARFVLIKRTDSTGDWYVWDSARGIVSGNDPYLLLNSTAAEVTSTDYIDTYSAGFEISSTAPAAINASGGTFIFLAIA